MVPGRYRQNANRCTLLRIDIPGNREAWFRLKSGYRPVRGSFLAHGTDYHGWVGHGATHASLIDPENENRLQSVALDDLDEVTG